MPTRLTCAALLLIATALPLGLPTPAEAGPAQSYAYRTQRLGRLCPPPLKFAAGACLRRCPAGYQDNGRTCRLRNMWR